LRRDKKINEGDSLLGSKIRAGRRSRILVLASMRKGAMREVGGKGSSEIKARVSLPSPPVMRERRRVRRFRDCESSLPLKPLFDRRVSRCSP